MSHEYKTAAKIIIPIEIAGLFILFILSSLLDSMEIFMFFFWAILIVDLVVINGNIYVFLLGNPDSRLGCHIVMHIH